MLNFPRKNSWCKKDYYYHYNENWSNLPSNKKTNVTFTTEAVKKMLWTTSEGEGCYTVFSRFFFDSSHFNHYYVGIYSKISNPLPIWNKVDVITLKENMKKTMMWTTTRTRYNNETTTSCSIDDKNVCRCWKIDSLTLNSFSIHSSNEFPSSLILKFIFILFKHMDNIRNLTNSFSNSLLIKV